MPAELDSAHDEIVFQLEALRRELHEAQSKWARPKMLHARDQCESTEIHRMRMISIASLVEMGLAVKKAPSSSAR